MSPKRALAKLLHIKAGDHILLVNEPDGFQARLNPLPHDITFNPGHRDPADTICLFVVAESELARQLPGLADRLALQGRLWVFWPRRSGGTVTDLTDETIQTTAAASKLMVRERIMEDTDWHVAAFQRSIDGGRPAAAPHP